MKSGDSVAVCFIIYYMNRTPSTKKTGKTRERETDRQTNNRMQSARGQIMHNVTDGERIRQALQTISKRYTFINYVSCSYLVNSHTLVNTQFNSILAYCIFCLSFFTFQTQINSFVTVLCRPYYTAENDGVIHVQFNKSCSSNSFLRDGSQHRLLVNSSKPGNCIKIIVPKLLPVLLWPV